MLLTINQCCDLPGQPWTSSSGMKRKLPAAIAFSAIVAYSAKYWTGTKLQVVSLTSTAFRRVDLTK